MNKLETSSNQNKGQGRLIKVHVDLAGDSDGDRVYVGAPEGGLWRTNNASSPMPDWTCLTNNIRVPGMGINDIAINPIDPKIIYISTGRGEGDEARFGMGILKTSNGDSENPTWVTTDLKIDPSQQDISQATQGVFLSPDNPNVIFAFAGNKIWKSTNAGQDFDERYPLGTGADDKRFFRDLVFLGSDHSTIFVSCDDAHADAGGAYVLKSIDNGQTWDPVTGIGFNTTNERIDLAVSPADDDLVVAYCSEGISSSTDGGSSWALVNPTYTGKGALPGTNGFWMFPKYLYQDLVISESNVNTMYTGAITSGISVDGGASFDEMFRSASDPVCHVDIRDLALYTDQNGNDVLLLANDGGLHKYFFNTTSNPNAWEWKNLSGTGLEIAEIYGFDFSPDRSWISVGCQDLGFYNFDGQDWHDHDDYLDGCGALFVPNRTIHEYDDMQLHTEIFSPSYMIGLTNMGTRIYSLNGANDIEHRNVLNELGNWDRKMVLDCEGDLYIANYPRWGPGSPNPTLFRAGYGSPFYRTATAGLVDRYQKIGEFPNSKDKINGIGISKSDPNIGYIGMDHSHVSDQDGNFHKALFKSTNLKSATPTFADITGNLLDQSWIGVSDILVDPNNPDNVWVCVGVGYLQDGTTCARIQFSSNGGVTFNYLDDGLYHPDETPYKLPIYCMVMDEATGGIYIGTQFGVMYNPDPDDLLSDWYCFNENLPSTEVRQLKIDYCERKILAGTYGRGLWEAELAEEPRINQIITTDILLNTDPRFEVLEKSGRYNEINRFTVPPTVYPYHNHFVNSQITPARFFNTDITIPSGKTMTVKGKVIMAANTSITIEVGANLIVDGGIITSMCGQWSGIIVECAPAKSQDPTTKQGYVRIINGGTIEHAKDGIQLAGVTANENIDFGSFGGIVRTTDAIFKNNNRDVSFYSYKNRLTGFVGTIPNVSSFTKTSFIIDDGFRGDHNKPGHNITLWSVQSVKIVGCTFDDQRTSSFVSSPWDRKTGIKSNWGMHLLHTAN